MRICSLLPSATEIIAELGLIESLVGVSEECRWPPEVIGKPVVTAARIDAASLTSLEIDEVVRDSVRDGVSLYTVDAELIGALAPDLIVTQDLCTVCAVSSGQLVLPAPSGRRWSRSIHERSPRWPSRFAHSLDRLGVPTAATPWPLG